MSDNVWYERNKTAAKEIEVGLCELLEIVRKLRLESLQFGHKINRRKLFMIETGMRDALEVVRTGIE